MATLASAAGGGCSEQGLALRLANAPCISSVCQSGARCLPSWNLTLRGRKNRGKARMRPMIFSGTARGRCPPLRLTANAFVCVGADIIRPPWLPLTRELSSEARLRECNGAGSFCQTPSVFCLSAKSTSLWEGGTREGKPLPYDVATNAFVCVGADIIRPLWLDRNLRTVGDARPYIPLPICSFAGGRGSPPLRCRHKCVRFRTSDARPYGRRESPRRTKFSLLIKSLNRSTASN